MDNIQFVFENFITRCGDKLYDGQKEYRFISFNVPNLHMIEDPTWHLPDPWEQEDAFKTIAQIKGQAIRIYTLSIKGGINNSQGIQRSHVNGPGEFDEELFVCLDKVMELANRYGIRVIIPFVDQAKWWGGVSEYAAFRGKEGKDFWTDPLIREDFKGVIEFLLNRTNTFTGVKYKDDKAILCWETGNEIAGATDEWTRDIAAFIKSIDPNHLVMDGNDRVNPTALDCKDIDIVTCHYYNYSDDTPFVERCRRDREKTKGIKPFTVGEYGITYFQDMKSMTEEAVNNGTSGALIWSLRFHNKDGGFYFHHDGNKPVTSRSYHYPGFKENDDYYERAVMEMIIENSNRIQGLVQESLPVPEAPVLLPVKEPGNLSWRGSVGAVFYEVERSESADGPWITVGKNISDCRQEGPLFVDEETKKGKNCFYRVKAGNPSGISVPSNVESNM